MAQGIRSALRSGISASVHEKNSLHLEESICHVPPHTNPLGYFALPEKRPAGCHSVLHAIHHKQNQPIYLITGLTCPSQSASKR